MFDRVIMTVRMLTKTKTLKNRNTRCFLVLKSCLPRSTACKRKQKKLFSLTLVLFLCIFLFTHSKRKGMRDFTLTVKNVARITTQESA